MKVCLNDNWIKDNGKYECPYCKKEYSKMGICSHIVISHLSDPNKPRKNNFANYNLKVKNKELSPCKKGTHLSEKQKLQIKENHKVLKEKGELYGLAKWAKDNSEQHKISSSKGGGLRKQSGKGHKGYYKNVWCDSSWELAFLIYNLDFNNNIQRNKEAFSYLYNNKVYKYYPDFILNGEYVEIKGYEDEKAKEKKKQFPHKLLTYYSDDIKHILEYVKTKYGNDFIKLYTSANIPSG